MSRFNALFSNCLLIGASACLGLAIFSCASLNQLSQVTPPADIEYFWVYHNTDLADDLIKNKVLECLKPKTNVTIEVRWIDSEEQLANLLMFGEKNHVFALVYSLSANSPGLRIYQSCLKIDNGRFVLLQNQ